MIVTTCASSAAVPVAILSDMFTRTLHHPHRVPPGTVYRIEPQGPRGFEDRTTFNVFDRSAFSAANSFPLKLLNSTVQGTETISYVASPLHEIKVVSDSGVYTQFGTDVDGTRARRCDAFPYGTTVGSPSACLAACQGDAQCVAWVYADDQGGNQNCYPLQVLFFVFIYSFPASAQSKLCA